MGTLTGILIAFLFAIMYFFSGGIKNSYAELFVDLS